jgi:hypothetical protein
MPVRSIAPWRRSTVALACLVGLGGALVLAPTAQATSIVTPGNFTGYGFDQCVAPRQAVMDAWLTSSPYWAIGIYIAGDSRGCTYQPNLTPEWVSTQLHNGWRLLPLTVGPQASCATRYRQEARISPNPDGHYAKARKQGRKEAASTVRAALALGISPRSTLWYDIEPFDITRTGCRESALTFLSAWTRKLHDRHFVSGVYSNAASGMTMLDAAARRPGRHTMPDRIWIAHWNLQDDLYSPYIRDTIWMPHKRVHQYRGATHETHGGIRLKIDLNYMSLGRGSVAPAVAPACGVGIDLAAYHRIHLGASGREVKALHCLLKRNGPYKGKVHGQFKERTKRAVASYQRSQGLRATGAMSPRTWTALLSSGPTPILKFGSAGGAVRRVQRAMNAAVGARLRIDGVYGASTAAAVEHYQQVTGLPLTSVVATDTWTELQLGRV